MPTLIYVADDSPETLPQIAAVLRENLGTRATVTEYATCNGVLGAVMRHPARDPGILVMDLCMEGGWTTDMDRALAGKSKSWEVIRQAVDRGLKTIVLSNLDKDDALTNEYRICAWLSKPKDLRENRGLGLVRCVESVLPTA